jgi:antitoxin component YwqK of YwqJK toxin-antitoxin module
MLLELAALNAAFGVIKTTLENGKELIDAGASLGEFFGAEREVKKKLESGSLSVEDAFTAKRDLERAEAFLKEKLNTERVEGYRIWLDFKNAYVKEQREAERKERIRKAKQAKEIKEFFIMMGKVAGIILTIVAATFGVTFYLSP